MSTLLLGAHRPGTTPLHRLPAGTKLSALLLAGPAVALTHGWPSTLIGLGATAGLIVLARLQVLALGRALRGLLVLVVVLGGWLAWQVGWQRSLDTVGDLVILVLLATIVTTTTPVDAMLDAIERALHPLRAAGVNPERVALAFSLVLRAIPATIGLAEETRDAARARGLERDVRARLTPFAIRVVSDAQATGEALHARGVGDD